MEFRIVEQKSINYEAVKQAYLNGIRGRKLMDMFGIGSSQYTRLLRDFREDGINVPRQGHCSINKPAKWYTCESYGKYTYYVVKRVINGKRYVFARFKTEKEAINKVEELKQNNWDGLIE